MRYRSLTVSFFLMVIILVVGLIAGGIVRYVFFPEFDADFLSAQVELRDGAPESLIQNIVTRMDQGLREVSDELQKEYGLEESIVKNVFASVNGGKAASFQVELLKNEDRGDSVIPMKEIETRWRERVGDIAGTRTLEFRSRQSFGGGKPISLRLQGPDFRQVEAAAELSLIHI